MNIARTMLQFLLLCGFRLQERRAADNTPPEGFVALFNGHDLMGWKGLVLARRWAAGPSQDVLRGIGQGASKGRRLDARALEGGRRRSCSTARAQSLHGQGYGNFELWVDWKIGKGGDSGIYLRGKPQVQIWDTSLTDRRSGLGGLYNNQKHPAIRSGQPTSRWANGTRSESAWSAIGDMHLNDQLAVDTTPLENYWDRSQPLDSPARSNCRTTAIRCGSRISI